MSTAQQAPKVQLVDVLDKAAADAELIGQRLHQALGRMYFAAQKDEDLTGDYSEAHEADVSLRAIMPEVRRAAKAYGDRGSAPQGKAGGRYRRAGKTAPAPSHPRHEHRRSVPHG
jgi:hypothetical protein